MRGTATSPQASNGSRLVTIGASDPLVHRVVSTQSRTTGGLRPAEVLASLRSPAASAAGARWQVVGNVGLVDELGMRTRRSGRRRARSWRRSRSCRSPRCSRGLGCAAKPRAVGMSLETSCRSPSRCCVRDGRQGRWIYPRELCGIMPSCCIIVSASKTLSARRQGHRRRTGDVDQLDVDALAGGSHAQELALDAFPVARARATALSPLKRTSCTFMRSLGKRRACTCGRAA